jgi:hypothetical protein
MALFPQRANGSGDSLLWMKFNELVTLLNKWSIVVDADTVDGTHLSGLSVSGAVENADLDTLDVTGLYKVLTVPATLIHIRWDVNYAMQIKQKYNTVDFEIRQKAGNVWGAWRTIRTEINTQIRSGQVTLNTTSGALAVRQT